MGFTIQYFSTNIVCNGLMKKVFCHSANEVMKIIVEIVMKIRINSFVVDNIVFSLFMSIINTVRYSFLFNTVIFIYLIVGNSFLYLSIMFIRIKH
jgi:hypothetical protein